ncbi:MAG: ATP-binding cassette domain-containing protein [Rhodospirillaceae bacterium]|nr:ATP-binding cassette domain-containing protein [Rhodospirillaceae bacterium]
MTATALIELREASVVRAGRAILERVSLTVSAGEIVTLIGPNGAGKTTAVRLALGLERADAGAVIRRADLRVGYQPQRISVEPTLPLPVRRLLTLTQSHPRADLIAALDTLGVAHLIDADIHVLSGGELQRVMLARAFLRKPHLLVLDEPTQNLDVNGALDIYRLIAGVRDALNCGVLLVSHDLNVVMAGTSRVYCLNGHVCCSGHPEHVSRHPEFLRLFGTAATDALAVYTHRHDHTHAPDGHAVPAAGASHDHHHHHHHDQHHPH